MDPQALEDLLELQDVLHILFASELRFEAHHWGSYALYEAPKHDKGLLPMAVSLDAPSEHFIFYDAERRGFFIPALTQVCVAKHLDEFISLPKSGESYTRGQLFDLRQNFDTLIPESDYLVTSINVATPFNFTESYEVLTQLAIELSDGAFAPDEISAIQLPNDSRELTLRLENRKHIIRLKGETFDDEFLHGLNMFLIDAGVNHFKFAMTKNEAGFFVLLKLNANQYELLESQGILSKC